MDKTDVARALREIGVLLEMKGENPFKTRSYENAARSLEGAEEDVASLVETGELINLKGIGKAIAEKITELVQGGRLAYLETLRAEIPDGLPLLTRIPGFGPKKARAVWNELGIEDMDALEKAAHTGRLALPLSGFGPKSEAKILEGIAFCAVIRDGIMFRPGQDLAANVVAALQKMKSVKRLEVAGSLRRRRETIKDIDIVVSTSEPQNVMDALELPLVEDVIAHGKTKSSATLSGGVNCDVRCVSDSEYPFALMYFTGSKEHNVAMRQRCKVQGLKLNEYGLYPDGSETSEKCTDEAAIYRTLGLDYIEPELREDLGELDAGESGTLPALIEDGDIQGLLHFHTTSSDGKATLEEMVRAAQGRGYKYAGVCDHSQSAAYARGPKPDEVKRQHEEIDKLQEIFPDIRILKGIESDILGGGDLDYEDSILASFDFIVASVHSRFSQSKEDMTKRIVAAVENPFTTFLGHPTGRLLLERDPYQVDLDAVIEAAARSNTAIEINANPHRLDLDSAPLQDAKKAGCRFMISPDAHSTEGIGDMTYGVGVARKGWLTRDDVANCLSRKDFLKFIGAS